MSSIEFSKSGVRGSLTLSSDDGTNSDIRRMIFKTDSVVPSLEDFISTLVGSRDDVFDLFVTINRVF